jgi:hypothetical protein
MKKTSAVFPDEEGNFGNKPSNSDLVVFHIGVRYNHPLGIFSPNGSTVGNYFVQMIKDLEDKSEEFGFLGATSWQNITAASKNELLIVCYFKNVEGLHKFAHSEYHLPAWQWWNKEIAKMPHISIYHETFHVPVSLLSYNIRKEYSANIVQAGNWESIHVNSHISGINSSVFKVIDDEGQEKYTYPIVDASKGLLKTSAGRMSRSQGLEHEKMLEVDPYDI